MARQRQQPQRPQQRQQQTSNFARQSKLPQQKQTKPKQTKDQKSANYRNSIGEKMIDYEVAREMGGFPNPLELFFSGKGRMLMLMHLACLIGLLVSMVDFMTGVVINLLAFTIIGYAVSTAAAFDYTGPIKNRKELMMYSAKVSAMYYGMIALAVIAISLTGSFLLFLVAAVAVPISFTLVIAAIVSEILARENQPITEEEAQHAIRNIKVIEDTYEEQSSPSSAPQAQAQPSSTPAPQAQAQPSLTPAPQAQVPTPVAQPAPVPPVTQAPAPQAQHQAQAPAPVSQAVTPAPQAPTQAQPASTATTAESASTSNLPNKAYKLDNEAFVRQDFKVGRPSVKVSLSQLPLLFALSEDLAYNACGEIMEIPTEAPAYTERANSLHIMHKIGTQVAKYPLVNVPPINWDYVPDEPNKEPARQQHRLLVEFLAGAYPLETEADLNYNAVINAVGWVNYITSTYPNCLVDSAKFKDFGYIPTNSDPEELYTIRLNGLSQPKPQPKPKGQFTDPPLPPSFQKAQAPLEEQEQTEVVEEQTPPAPPTQEKHSEPAPTSPSLEVSPDESEEVDPSLEEKPSSSSKPTAQAPAEDKASPPAKEEPEESNALNIPLEDLLSAKIHDLERQVEYQKKRNSPPPEKLDEIKDKLADKLEEVFDELKT